MDTLVRILKAELLLKKKKVKKRFGKRQELKLEKKELDVYLLHSLETLCLC
jgi:hypothetical protein